MNKILMTGGSGFLGNNILPILRKNSSCVDTVGLSDADNYKMDISKSIPVLLKDYDIILHAAGKAHCISNYDNYHEYFLVNMNGTINLCRALENKKKPSALIFISSVAVYGCEYGENINEEHELNGITPYALSKIYAEEYLKIWCDRNNVKLGVLRPSLIYGFNPVGNLGAMKSAIKNGYYFNVKGIHAKRSICLASDIADVLPILSQKGGTFNICDSHNPSFFELSSEMAKALKVKTPHSIPKALLYSVGKVGDILKGKFPYNSEKFKKMVNNLTFSNEKILNELRFIPKDVLSHIRKLEDNFFD